MHDRSPRTAQSAQTGPFASASALAIPDKRRGVFVPAHHGLLQPVDHVISHWRRSSCFFAWLPLPRSLIQACLRNTQPTCDSSPSWQLCHSNDGQGCFKGSQHFFLPKCRDPYSNFATSTPWKRKELWVLRHIKCACLLKRFCDLMVRQWRTLCGRIPTMKPKSIPWRHSHQSFFSFWIPINIGSG
jgi:hypothetical protein